MRDKNHADAVIMKFPPLNALPPCVQSKRGVLLVYRSVLPNVLQGFPRKTAEIPVFAHFGVVDMPLTADPPQQGLFLNGSGIATKFISDLHR